MSNIPATVDDAELMRRASADDRGAFGELVRRYRPALVRVAHSRLGRADWAEDVVQESFLAAYRARRSYRPQFAFRTWLWTILLRGCARHARQRIRREQLVRIEPVADRAPIGDQVDRDSPSAALLAQERAHELDALLGQLRDEVADALRLRFFGGLKFQEIADAMQCSLLTAKNRVRSGLEQLAVRLRPAETDGASGADRR